MELVVLALVCLALWALVFYALREEDRRDARRAKDLEEARRLIAKTEREYLQRKVKEENPWR